MLRALPSPRRQEETKMDSRAKRSTRRIVALAATGLILGVIASPAGAERPGPDGLYVPPPNHGAKTQIAELTSSGDKESADQIRDMIRTPQAVWFTAGTPKSVRQDVRNTVNRAAAKRTVPVLVAYNIPFRDCAQFSAGGATTVSEYEAWIDGFVAGVGNGEAIVILEPDGLGIIPWYDPYGDADGSTDLEWCQPDEADPDTAASDRFAMLDYAVEALSSLPNTTVYLDGTHSAWLGVGDIAHRLDQAGVDDADGFYLNASNYQFTTNGVQYGSWVSACLATASDPAGFVDCPNQYWNGGPFPAKIAELLGEWTGVALGAYGEWSDDSDDPALNTSGINLRYDGANPTTRFVVDTSRNGQGPWQPPAYPDPQDWCNPPGRGLGLAPSTETGIELVDAFLWIKIPGESDGECTRGLGPSGETVDPEWGIIDPPAGAWFPEMALDLVQSATP
jgi:endoglucanase